MTKAYPLVRFEKVPKLYRYEQKASQDKFWELSHRSISKVVPLLLEQNTTEIKRLILESFHNLDIEIENPNSRIYKFDANNDFIEYVESLDSIHELIEIFLAVERCEIAKTLNDDRFEGFLRFFDISSNALNSNDKRKIGGKTLVDFKRCGSWHYPDQFKENYLNILTTAINYLVDTEEVAESDVLINGSRCDGNQFRRALRNVFGGRPGAYSINIMKKVKNVVMKGDLSRFDRFEILSDVDKRNLNRMKEILRSSMFVLNASEEELENLLPAVRNVLAKICQAAKSNDVLREELGLSEVELREVNMVNELTNALPSAINEVIERRPIFLREEGGKMYFYLIPLSNNLVNNDDLSERLARLQQSDLQRFEKLEIIADIYCATYLSSSVNHGAAHNSLMLMSACHKIAFPDEPVPQLAVGKMLDLDLGVEVTKCDASMEEALQIFKDKFVRGEYFDLEQQRERYEITGHSHQDLVRNSQNSQNNNSGPSL